MSLRTCTKVLLPFFIVVNSSRYSCAQTADQGEYRELSVGTGLLLNATGTFNLNLSYLLTSKLRLTGTVGFLPMGYRFDLMSGVHGYGTFIDRGISSSLYLQCYAEIIMMDILSTEVSLYGGFRRWDYTIQDVVEFELNKFCFGMGADFELANNFSVRPNFGLYMGYDRIRLNNKFDYTSMITVHDKEFDEITDKYGGFLAGFDLGFSLHYTFKW